MSRDDYIYVGKRDGRYVIVNRAASLEYPDEIEADEQVMAYASRPSVAVLEANRIQTTEHFTEYGVIVSDSVKKALGWKIHR